ncbi:MAG: class I SAM-dependent methyltransferase family protein [Methanothrix sp.]|nr:class I SAM-dependent methyltransferase family protein [Methanothrix sp.]
MRLKEKLWGVVPDEKLCKISEHFQLIGDVAIVSLPVELHEYKTAIAKAVLSQAKNIRMVLNKTSKIEGDMRLASFEVLAGSGNAVTLHREFGFVFRLDVTRVFFNSRLGYERIRVARQVQSGEQVLVPFAGVGPFVVPMAARGARVLAVEKNREACKWLAENVRLNRVDGRTEIVNADVFEILYPMKTYFDRAVVPTPYGMDSILEAVSSRVKKGGMVHFYTFKKSQQIAGLVQSYKDMGFKVEAFRKCGNVAPGVSRWAFDLKKN